MTNLDFPYKENIEKMWKDLSLLRKAKEAHISPFPYIRIDDALPKEVYDDLLETRPSYETILHGRDPGSNLRLDNPAKYSLEHGVPPIWADFITYHTSKHFLNEVLSLFGPAIDLAYPKIRLSGILNEEPGIRGLTNKPFFMDCLVGVNTPCVEESTVKHAHLDNPVELYAGLFYMGEDQDGGELIVNRLIKPARFYGKNEIYEDCVEEISRVPYRHNQFFMFLNTPCSVHSVSPRNSKNPRNLVNVIGEFKHPLFKYQR